MGVLGALFGGTSLALRGGGNKPAQAPPINASSSDEADFIKYLLRNLVLFALVADAATGNLWRKQRRKRSQRRNTRSCRTSSDEHGDLIPGITSTTIDRTDTRQLCSPKLQMCFGNARHFAEYKSIHTPVHQELSYTFWNSIGPTSRTRNDPSRDSKKRFRKRLACPLPRHISELPCLEFPESSCRDSTLLGLH